MGFFEALFRRKAAAEPAQRSSKATGAVAVFEVFGRSTPPDGAVVGRVCQTWVQSNPGVNPGNARVKVNSDTSGLWTNGNVRAHYPLLHYRGHKHLWEFLTVSGKQYLLLVVFES